jgi:hypothetical protein
MEALRSLRFSALARPASEPPDTRTEAPEIFTNVEGNELTLIEPVLKAAIMALRPARHGSMSYSEVETAVREQLGPERIAELAASLFKGMAHGLIGFDLLEHPYAVEPGERPWATPLARHIALSGGSPSNLRGNCRNIQDFERAVLVHCDGQNNHDDLVSRLVAIAMDGKLGVLRDGAAVQDRGELTEIIGPLLDHALESLAEKAFFRAG